MGYVVLYFPVLRIIGPFTTGADAEAWGRNWQSENLDNPCWNTIDGSQWVGKHEIVIPIETP